MPPDPFVAFLSAIQDAQAAGGGSRNAFTPGAQGIPGGISQVPGDGSVGGSVAAGGSVPGTATTGPNIVEGIVSGQIPPDSQVATDIISMLGIGGFSGEPGERGDLGEGVTGGSLGALGTVLSGPLAPATMLASIVASDALGLPIDPALLTTTSLADMATGGLGQGAGLGGGSEGGFSINSDGSITPAQDRTVGPGGSSPGVGPIRVGGPIGGGSDNDRDTSPGPSPNRGTGPSNAGR